MTETTKPEALLLADEVKRIGFSNNKFDFRLEVELRRQHAEIERLRAERDTYKSRYEHIRDEGCTVTVMGKVFAEVPNCWGEDDMTDEQLDAAIDAAKEARNVG